MNYNSILFIYFISFLKFRPFYLFDFVDLSELKNYIFMTYSNEYNYIIHNIINDKETYSFQYKKIKENKEENDEVKTTTSDNKRFFI